MNLKPKTRNLILFSVMLLGLIIIVTCYEKYQSLFGNANSDLFNLATPIVAFFSIAILIFTL